MGERVIMRSFPSAGDAERRRPRPALDNHSLGALSGQGRLSILSALNSKSFCMVLLYGCGVLDQPFRRFWARAVWVKQSGTVVSFARTLEQQGRLTTPLLRQVFGVEPMHAEGRWFDPDYASTHFRPDLR
jgi:hypothetical protein